jgi:hypothetical protein
MPYHDFGKNAFPYSRSWMTGNLWNPRTCEPFTSRLRDELVGEWFVVNDYVRETLLALKLNPYNAEPGYLSDTRFKLSSYLDHFLTEATDMEGVSSGALMFTML